MPDPGSVASGAFTAASWLADTYLGDGEVRVHTQQASVYRWRCEDNEQLAAVCQWRTVRFRLARYVTRTYAFTSGVGYESQWFDVKLIAEVNGCDVRGAFIYATGYGESLIGRTSNWTVSATALDSPRTRPSGCDDCCPRCAAVGFALSVSTPGFLDSMRITVYGNGSCTRERL